MSTDSGESWLEGEWLSGSSIYTDSSSQVRLSGDGSFLYLIDGSTLLKLSTSSSKSSFSSTRTPIMSCPNFQSPEVSYSGPFTVGYYLTEYTEYTGYVTTSTIYTSSSLGSQWSEKSTCTCSSSSSGGGFSVSSTGRCGT